MNKKLFKGRRKPYSDTGIKRVPCARCGKPSRFQWQVCANDNLYLGICGECDIELNRMVLDFFRFSNKEKLLSNYIESKRNDEKKRKS
jgi:hypothetical protein